jgi:hypothetical protein
MLHLLCFVASEYGGVQWAVMRQRPEWFFRSKVPNIPSCYSRRFADWFVTRYQQQPDWLSISWDVRRASWKLKPKPKAAAPGQSLGIDA